MYSLESSMVHHVPTAPAPSNGSLYRTAIHQIFRDGPATREALPPYASSPPPSVIYQQMIPPVSYTPSTEPSSSSRRRSKSNGSHQPPSPRSYQQTRVSSPIPTEASVKQIAFQVQSLEKFSHRTDLMPPVQLSRW